MALELARTGAELRAVVGFHPGLGTTKTDDSRHIKGSVLMCIGSDDPLAPLDARVAFENEMRDAGVADWRLYLLGGAQHTFTNPEADTAGIPGVAYNRKADERSWQAMLDLFAETLT
jgi:dienelactone hydrolase